MKAILFLATLCLSFIASASDAFLSRDHAITIDTGIVRYRMGTSVQKQPDGKFLMPDRRIVELPADILTPHQLAVPPVAVSIVPATPVAKSKPTPTPARTIAAKPAPALYKSPLGTPRLDMRRPRQLASAPASAASNTPAGRQKSSASFHVSRVRSSKR